MGRSPLVLIFCQGTQMRLAGHISCPKHHVKVGGEPIIGRTLRLLHDQGVHSLAVHAPDHPTWRAMLRDRALLYPLERPGLCILDGMDASAHLWRQAERPVDADRVVLLLGDVIWSRAALSAVLADERPIVFAGTPDLTTSTGELFALSVHASARKGVSCALEAVPCRRDQRLGTYPRAQPGHLRHLLWHMWGKERHPPPAVSPALPEELYLPICDYTTDLDTPEDLAGLPAVEAHVRRDV